MTITDHYRADYAAAHSDAERTTIWRTYRQALSDELSDRKMSVSGKRPAGRRGTVRYPGYWSRLPQPFADGSGRSRALARQTGAHQF